MQASFLHIVETLFRENPTLTPREKAEMKINQVVKSKRLESFTVSEEPEWSRGNA